MSVALPRIFQPEPPRASELLQKAIRAHEVRMVQSATDRAGALPALVKAVLGVSPERITYGGRLHDPIAIVDGLMFKGDALDPYSLEGGWLCVRTKHNGWEEVRSLEHLGQIAKRTPLALVEAS